MAAPGRKSPPPCASWPRQARCRRAAGGNDRFTTTVRTRSVGFWRPSRCIIAVKQPARKLPPPGFRRTRGHPEEVHYEPCKWPAEGVLVPGTGRKRARMLWHACTRKPQARRQPRLPRRPGDRTGSEPEGAGVDGRIRRGAFALTWCGPSATPPQRRILPSPVTERGDARTPHVRMEAYCY